VTEGPPAHAGRDTARRVIPLFRPYRLQVAFVVGLIVVTSTVGIVNPLLIQAVFNHALFVRGGPRLGLLYVLVAIMAAVPIVNGAIGILQTYQTTRVGQQVMRDLRDRLYSHLETLSLAFFTNTKTGEIQSRLANDVGGVQTVVTTTASDHPGQRGHVRLVDRGHDHHQLAADHRVGVHRAGLLLVDARGWPAAAPGVEVDTGGAGGDERADRGDAVGERGAAG
jgi:ABC-type multidrug transport system fused ATPase/permease subunit